MRREETAPDRPVPSSGICLATALCDPEAELLPKARNLWPSLQATFATQAIHVTSDTHPDWLEFLAANAVPTRQTLSQEPHNAFAKRSWWSTGSTH